MKIGTLCYLRKNGKTLMLHRIKKENDMHEGKWNGLGGKVQSGESPEECAVREVFEESGLRVIDPQMRGFITFPNFANDDDWYVFLFVADQFDGELIDSPEGVLQWVPTDELLDLNLWEGDRIFIPWLEENRFFSAKFVYEKNHLVHHEVTFHC
jgi:8-oxo-dGTP diphosphatase